MLFETVDMGWMTIIGQLRADGYGTYLCEEIISFVLD
jgi:hypothetical protein